MHRIHFILWDPALSCKKSIGVHLEAQSTQKSAKKLKKIMPYGEHIKSAVDGLLKVDLFQPCRQIFGDVFQYLYNKAKIHEHKRKK